jgi:hypothetical protein
MRIDGLALRLRARTAVQASDLGVRLCQATAGPVYGSFAVVAVPMMVVALATSELAVWLPIFLIWCAKPWLDRTILFVLSRAAFGQPTTPLDVWRERRQVWWRHAWYMGAIRLSPWRAVTEPIYVLEGLSIRASRRRARQLRRTLISPGVMLTHTYAVAELCLLAGLLSLLVWFAPPQLKDDAFALLDPRSSGAALVVSVAYGVVVFVLEPFYVASGFAMYLNRRAELEAWDIEQEFRRLFAD